MSPALGAFTSTFDEASGPVIPGIGVCPGVANGVDGEFEEFAEPLAIV